MSDDRDKEQQGEHGEPEPSAEERAEAEALAAALDGQPHAHEPPEDALSAALLMRHGGARGELSNERAEAILSELLSAPPATEDARRSHDAKAKTAVPAARTGKVVQLLPWAAAVTAAAATLLLMWRVPSVSPQTRAGAPEQAESADAPGGPRAGRSLGPPVPAGLLSAQSAWLRAGLEREHGASAPSPGERAATTRFENELRAYRADLFRALHGAYPSKQGQRAPDAEPRSHEAARALAVRAPGVR